MVQVDVTISSTVLMLLHWGLLEEVQPGLYQLRPLPKALKCLKAQSLLQQAMQARQQMTYSAARPNTGIEPAFDNLCRNGTDGSGILVGSRQQQPAADWQKPALMTAPVINQQKLCGDITLRSCDFVPAEHTGRPATGRGCWHSSQGSRRAYSKIGRHNSVMQGTRLTWV